MNVSMTIVTIGYDIYPIKIPMVPQSKKTKNTVTVILITVDKIEEIVMTLVLREGIIIPRSNPARTEKNIIRTERLVIENSECDENIESAKMKITKPEITDPKVTSSSEA